MLDKAEMFLCIFMAGVTLWIVRKYLNGLLPKKMGFSLIESLFWIGYLIYQIVLESGESGNLLLVLVNALFIFAISHAGYDGKVRTKILYTVLLCVIWSIVEMVAFYALQIALMPQEPAFRRFGSFFTKLLLVFLVHAFATRFKEGGKKNLPAKYIGLLLIISISGIVIAYNLFLMDYEEKRALTILSFVLLLFMNCMIFEIYQKLYQNMEMERENAIFAQQLKLISKHEKEQEEIRLSQREFRHNLVHFCTGIRAALQEGNSVQALEEVEKLLRNETFVEKGISHCGNDLVDSLINHKYEIAKRYQIDMDTNINIPTKLSVEYGALAVVLGNLLDNAIEAARECVGEKKISISMGVKKKQLVIVVRNTFEKEPKKDMDGDFVTAKDDTKEHGFGIRSVKRIAEKYEGSSLFHIHDNMFEAIVLLTNSKD